MMSYDIKTSKTWILFLLFPSFILLFSGCLDTFIITIVPAILSNQRCFYSEPRWKNGSRTEDDENKLIFIETSYVISSKIITRLPMNLLAGYFISKLGSEYVIILGLLIYGTSLIMYVFSNGCTNFIISRVVEGISASFAVTASYSFISTVFVKKNDKSIAMAFGNFCFYTGVCFGPFVGGYLYSTFGHDSTFLFIIPFHLCLCVASLINLINWKNYIDRYIKDHAITKSKEYILKENKFFDIFKIFINPYIIINCFGVAICNGTIAALSTILPQWMKNNFQSGKQEQGIVWILGGVIYGLAEIVSAYVGIYLGDFSFICPIIGAMLISVSVFTISLHVKWTFLTLNMIFIFFGLGLVEYYLFPLMTLLCNILVNRRSYSIAAALITTSNSLGCLFGAIISGIFSQLFGFRITCFIFGCVLGIYAPVIILLSSFTSKEYESSVDIPLEAGDNGETVEILKLIK